MPNVSEMMSRDVRTVKPDDSLQAAARLMAEIDVGSLPVCTGERIQGIVTDRDITIRGVAKGLDVASTAVREVMSASVEFCRDTDTVEKAAEQMGRRQIRRLPVLDASDRLVGILALGDVAVKGDEGEAAEALTDISERS